MSQVAISRGGLPPAGLHAGARPLLGALVLASALAACGGERARARAIAVDWRAGQTYRYTAHVRSHAGFEGQSPFVLDVVTRLAVTPVWADGARVELALALSDVALKVGDGHPVAGDNPILAGLAQPYQFTLEGGRLVEQRFAPNISPVAAGIVRELAAGFQLAARPARADNWSSREVDGTGSYEAEYRLAAPAGTVEKRKRRYETVAVAGTIDAAARARIVPQIQSSSGTIRVAAGNLTSIDLDNAVRTQVLLKAPLNAETKLAIELVGVAPAAAGAPTRAGLLASTVVQPLDRAYGDGHAGQMFDDARIDGRSFEQLLVALKAAAADPAMKELWAAKNGQSISAADRGDREQRLGSRASAFSGMVALLRQQPGAIAKAARAVRSDTPAAQVLTDAMVAAGTEAAQAAVADLVIDRDLAKNLRVAAASSLIRVQRATPRTVATLDGLVADPLLAEHGVFGLGTAARRLREAGEIARARDISERLVALLAAAKTPVEQIRCLRGVANSAYPGALEPVHAFFSAPDTSVRIAAVDAVLLVPDAAADALVGAAMLKDADPRVRIAAVRGASVRHPSDGLAAALMQVALSDGDAVARKNAVELLGRWLPERSNLRSTLQEVLAKDDRADIRAAAQAALSKA